MEAIQARVDPDRLRRGRDRWLGVRHVLWVATRLGVAELGFKTVCSISFRAMKASVVTPWSSEELQRSEPTPWWSLSSAELPGRISRLTSTDRQDAKYPAPLEYRKEIRSLYYVLT